MIRCTPGAAQRYRKPARSASSIRSGSWVNWRWRGCHVSSATTMPMNETALIAKTGAAPSHATRKPANAGPMARAAFTVMLPSAAALGICSRGTRSG